MIKTHFVAIFWNFQKIFTQKKWGQIAVGLAYLGILVFLFVAVFALGFGTFRFLYTFSEVSPPLVRYILLSALAFTTLISIVSFTITLTQRLFTKKLTPYFLTPNSAVSIFQALFWENFFLGSWPFLVLALPLLLAYLVVLKAPITLYPYLGLLLLLLISFTESVGGILALSLRYIFGAFSKKVIYFSSFATFLTLAFFLKKVFLPTGLWEVAERPTLPEVFSGLTTLPVANPFLPPALFLDSLAKNWTPISIFVLQVVASYFLCLLVVRKLYRLTWQRSQEGIFLARPLKPGTLASQRETNFYGVHLSLFKKESLLIDRTPSLLLYFIFVLFLALVFFFLLSQSPHSPEFSPAIFQKVVASTMMVVGYLTTMIALRFSFPSLTLEFPTFWVLSPLSPGRQKIFLTKWLIYTILPTATAWIFGILAFFILRLPADFLPFILGLSLSCAIVICALNLFAGTVWAPRLPRENIEEITTATPAVLATLLSILISVLGGLFFYRQILVTSSGEIIISSKSGGVEWMLILVVFAFLFWITTFSWAKKRFLKMDIF